MLKEKILEMLIKKKGLLNHFSRAEGVEDFQQGTENTMKWLESCSLPGAASQRPTSPIEHHQPVGQEEGGVKGCSNK